MNRRILSRRRLNVAIVAPSLAILGGQAVQANRLIRAWQGDPDVKVWLVPVNPTPPRAIRFALRVKYLRTIVTQFLYLPLLVRELLKADVVHVFSASYSSFLLAPLPAMLIARALGRPTLLNYRSGEAAHHLAGSALARTAIARVDRNVVPSSYLVHVFRRFGVDATVIPNIVDLEHFRYRERNPLRPRLISTRNFEALYNIDCTLRAFRRVQEERPDASLTLVGTGPEEERLRALASDLGVQRVTFAGAVPPSEIAEHYAAHDIYVQSPNLDNMPTSVLEAFASGLPVVSTDAGGIPTILTHRTHGLLAAVNDDAALAEHILHLLADPAAAIRMARAAHDTCQHRTWASVRDEWCRIYHDLAAPEATPHSTRKEIGTLLGATLATSERPTGEDHAG